jgi:hypothetical protein
MIDPATSSTSGMRPTQGPEPSMMESGFIQQLEMTRARSAVEVRFCGNVFRQTYGKYRIQQIPRVFRNTELSLERQYGRLSLVGNYRRPSPRGGFPEARWKGIQLNLALWRSSPYVMLRLRCFADGLQRSCVLMTVLFLELWQAGFQFCGLVRAKGVVLGCTVPFLIWWLNQHAKCEHRKDEERPQTSGIF